MANYKPRSDVVINAGVRYENRPSSANTIGTMGHSKDRFVCPTVFYGSPIGPNYTSPGLVDTTNWKKFGIVGRKDGVAMMPGCTPDRVGPGTYQLPPVFGVH